MVPFKNFRKSIAFKFLSLDAFINPLNERDYFSKYLPS